MSEEQLMYAMLEGLRLSSVPINELIDRSNYFKL